MEKIRMQMMKKLQKAKKKMRMNQGKMKKNQMKAKVKLKVFYKFARNQTFLSSILYVIYCTVHACVTMQFHMFPPPHLLSLSEDNHSYKQHRWFYLWDSISKFGVVNITLVQYLGILIKARNGKTCFCHVIGNTAILEIYIVGLQKFEQKCFKIEK